jgi:hypothetical protein
VILQPSCWFLMYGREYNIMSVKRVSTRTHRGSVFLLMSK